ncbi:RICIN domain-containing protein [Streptomyces sp. NPDC051561]|uniref:RICIN domain-containing protein n=1 Tax=Streptomyces sp. NPDC051561 TaxID=3365658 RepID=UPI0037A69DF8
MIFRKLTKVMAVLSAAAGFGALGVAHSPQAQAAESGRFVQLADGWPHNDLCLNTQDYSNVRGAYVLQMSCSSPGANEKVWHWSGRQIVHRSGLCLTPEGNAYANGTRLTIWPCSNAASQQWGYDKGKVYPYSRPSQAITSYANSGQSGYKVTLWTYTGNHSQAWGWWPA